MEPVFTRPAVLGTPTCPSLELSIQADGEEHTRQSGLCFAICASVAELVSVAISWALSINSSGVTQTQGALSQESATVNIAHGAKSYGETGQHNVSPLATRDED